MSEPANMIRGLLPDGSLPQEARAHVDAQVDNAAQPHVAAAQAAAAAAEAAAATVIVGAGRPDIPATMTQAVRDRVAAAPSGAVFRSTDGPQGAWEWQKRGAAWVVTSGDTGWRTITPDPGWTSTVLIRRIDSLIILRSDTLTAAEARPDGSPILASFPAGFGTPAVYAVTVTRSGTDGLTTRVIQGGVMHGPTVPAGGNLRFRYQFEATQSWPTVQPGT